MNTYVDPRIYNVKSIAGLDEMQLEEMSYSKLKQSYALLSYDLSDEHRYISYKMKVNSLAEYIHGLFADLLDEINSKFEYFKNHVDVQDSGDNYFDIEKITSYDDWRNEGDNLLTSYVWKISPIMSYISEINDSFIVTNSDMDPLQVVFKYDVSHGLVTGDTLKDYIANTIERILGVPSTPEAIDEAINSIQEFVDWFKGYARTDDDYGNLAYLINTIERKDTEVKELSYAYSYSLYLELLDLINDLRNELNELSNELNNLLNNLNYKPNGFRAAGDKRIITYVGQKKGKVFSYETVIDSSYISDLQEFINSNIDFNYRPDGHPIDKSVITYVSQKKGQVSSYQTILDSSYISDLGAYVGSYIDDYVPKVPHVTGGRFTNVTESNNWAYVNSYINVDPANNILDINGTRYTLSLDNNGLFGFSTLKQLTFTVSGGKNYEIDAGNKTENVTYTINKAATVRYNDVIISTPMPVNIKNNVSITYTLYATPVDGFVNSTTTNTSLSNYTTFNYNQYRSYAYSFNDAQNILISFNNSSSGFSLTGFNTGALITSVAATTNIIAKNTIGVPGHLYFCLPTYYNSPDSIKAHMFLDGSAIGGGVVYVNSVSQYSTNKQYYIYRTSDPYTSGSTATVKIVK